MRGQPAGAISKFSIQNVQVFALIVLVALLLSGGCRSVQSPEADAGMNQAIKAKLGAHFSSYPNTSGEYVLYVQRPTSEQGMTQFIVLDTTTKQLILESEFRAGYVKWITPHSIEVFSMPGIVQENEDLSNYVSVIDLKAQKH